MKINWENEERNRAVIAETMDLSGTVEASCKVDESSMRPE